MPSINNCRFLGDLVVSCELDGVEVFYLDPEWTADDTWKIASRIGAGAGIVTAFFPAVGILGAIAGAYSIIKDKGEGYYDAKKRKVRDGKIYSWDIS